MDHHAATDRPWVEDRDRTVRRTFEDERGILLSLFQPTSGSKSRSGPRTSTGGTTLSMGAPGAVTIASGSGSAMVVKLDLSGPNVRFENLDEGEALALVSSGQVRVGSNPPDTVQFTGTMDITANGTSATFSGGDITGSLTGTTLRPQVDNDCALVGVALDSLTVCGHDQQLSTMCLAQDSNGYALVFLDPGWTCGTERINELRLYVTPSPGGLFQAK